MGKAINSLWGGERSFKRYEIVLLLAPDTWLSACNVLFVFESHENSLYSLL